MTQWLRECLLFQPGNLPHNLWNDCVILFSVPEYCTRLVFCNDLWQVIGHHREQRGFWTAQTWVVFRHMCPSIIGRRKPCCASCRGDIIEVRLERALADLPAELELRWEGLRSDSVPRLTTGKADTLSLLTCDVRQLGVVFTGLVSGGRSRYDPRPCSRSSRNTPDEPGDDGSNRSISSPTCLCNTCRKVSHCLVFTKPEAHNIKTGQKWCS